MSARIREALVEEFGAGADLSTVPLFEIEDVIFYVLTTDELVRDPDEIRDLAERAASRWDGATL